MAVHQHNTVSKNPKPSFKKKKKKKYLETEKSLTAFTLEMTHILTEGLGHWNHVIRITTDGTLFSNSVFLLAHMRALLCWDHLLC